MFEYGGIDYYFTPDWSRPGLYLLRIKTVKSGQGEEKWWRGIFH
jgi:hypothetical protein